MHLFSWKFWWLWFFFILQELFLTSTCKQRIQNSPICKNLKRILSFLLIYFHFLVQYRSSPCGRLKLFLQSMVLLYWFEVPGKKLWGCLLCSENWICWGLSQNIRPKFWGFHRGCDHLTIFVFNWPEAHKPFCKLDTKVVRNSCVREFFWIVGGLFLDFGFCADFSLRDSFAIINIWSEVKSAPPWALTS